VLLFEEMQDEMEIQEDTHALIHREVSRAKAARACTVDHLQLCAGYIVSIENLLLWNYFRKTQESLRLYTINRDMIQ
jgi:hypothetical protein